MIYRRGTISAMCDMHRRESWRGSHLAIYLKWDCISDGMLFFFFSSRRRHTRFDCDWSSDVCSSDLGRGNERQLAGIKGIGLAFELWKLAGSDHTFVLDEKWCENLGVPVLARMDVHQIGRASCRERV